MTDAPVPGQSDSEAPTVLSPQSAGAASAPDVSRLTPGQTFGPYRIERLLGRGGMGEVYAAEHLEHGRLVALKVLNQRLAGVEDRARFMREGQLAASISHPNTVYIFGSEEIEGAPVIAMELVAGGTLKDRVDRDGPFPPAAAVDAILHVIAGLDAAQAGGILHRDIKPSNCFVDPDGAVKVGDFGLSISTLARDVSHETGLGTFQGTPQYAAPEQLRGQPLDLRADIYAVGATLYYLLTGHAPFDDRDLMALVTRVTTEAPASPRAGHRGVPRGLATIVLRCLAKDRAARPASYAALEDALRPFSSAAPTPATLGLRFAAGLVDKLILAAITAPLTVAPVLRLDPPDVMNLSVRSTTAGAKDATVFLTVAICVVTILYYGVLEGLGGASLGKRLCGLRVTRAGQPAGLVRAVGRTVIFMLPVWWTIFVPEGSAAANSVPANRATLLVAAQTVVGMVMAWITFTSMRRGNGYAAWHDLFTGTRVVLDRRDEVRARLDRARDEAPPAPVPGRRVGPFDVTGALGPTTAGELVAGFDAVLRRDVWLHVLPPGSPPLDPTLRDIGRSTRLRWLSGRRSATDAWDAYEAPDGASLLARTPARLPWRVVRHWMLDLAREIETSEREATLPVLALDRVWITRSSRAMLLDFRAPDSPARSIEAGSREPVPFPAAQPFLAAVASAAIDTHPLPLSARTTLDALARNAVPSAAEVTKRATTLSSGLDRVTSWRRGLSLALTNAPLVAVLIALLTVLPTAVRLMQIDFLLPSACLTELNRLESKTDDDAARLRRAVETHCSARFGRVYADEQFWRDGRTRELLAPLRPLAVRALANHPSVSPADAAAAAAAARPVLNTDKAKAGVATGIAIMMAFPSGTLLACAIVGLVSTTIVRGGVVMRLLGLASVNRHGAQLSRAGGLWRAIVAWSPILALWTYVEISTLSGRSFERTFSTFWVFGLAIGVAMAGAVWTVARPARGWHDRITGTWVVPR